MRIALVADSLPVVVYAPALALTMEVLMLIIVGTVGRRGGFNQIELQAGVMLEFLICTSLEIMKSETDIEYFVTHVIFGFVHIAV